mmetsp:Transcript_23279/g.20648  ORF Transcript_23279/g.20648 Transcript_23279/m.20648 type:complete len:119 (+) Transcript_23279:20-376(+)
MGKKSKTKDQSKDEPGPGSYKLKSFAENDIKPSVIFGSSSRFKQPIVHESAEDQKEFRRNSKGNLSLNRYFDRMGKEGPFVTIKGRRVVKDTDDLPGPGNYNVKHIETAPSFSMGMDK